MPGVVLPFVTALVPPGIDYEEDKHDEPQCQQHDRARPVFPKLPKASGDFIEIHAALIYTSLRERET